MCIFKNKFNSLKREEVVDTICSLERDEEELESTILTLTEQIKNMLEEGRNETDALKRTFLVKKITLLTEKRDRAVKQVLYILYNIRLSERLKDAIDDKSLVKRIASMKSISYFKDQKALALFLNDALNTKIHEEDVLTDADDTFMVIKEKYSENLKIYGITEMSEDNILAFFEDTKEEFVPKVGSEEATK